MTAKQTFKLTEASQETRKFLEERGLVSAGPIPKHMKFWKAVVNGEIPAQRAADGRSWELRRADLPVIVEALGLVAADATAAAA